MRHLKSLSVAAFAAWVLGGCVGEMEQPEGKEVAGLDASGHLFGSRSLEQPMIQLVAATGASITYQRVTSDAALAQLASGYQSFAPVAWDITPTQKLAHPDWRSDVIAATGTMLWVPTASPVLDVPTATAISTLAGALNGTSTTAPTGCTSISGVTEIYRPEAEELAPFAQSIGFTAVRGQTADTYFCPNIVKVFEGPSGTVQATKLLASGSSVPVTITGPGMCATTDTLYPCLGKLAARSGAMVFGGRLVARTGNRATKVASIVPTDAMLVAAVSNPSGTHFPFGFGAFLVESTTVASDATRETPAYNGLFATGTLQPTFATSLGAAGFVTAGASPLAWGLATVSGIDDGRGAGVGKSTGRLIR